MRLEIFAKNNLLNWSVGATTAILKFVVALIPNFHHATLFEFTTPFSQRTRLRDCLLLSRVAPRRSFTPSNIRDASFSHQQLIEISGGFDSWAWHELCAGWPSLSKNARAREFASLSNSAEVSGAAALVNFWRENFTAASIQCTVQWWVIWSSFLYCKCLYYLHQIPICI